MLFSFAFKEQIMKKPALFILVILMVVGISCKSTRKAATGEETYQTTLNQGTPAKIFSVPETSVSDEPDPEAEVVVRREDISFTQPKDESENKANNYFVIVGSFEFLDNAKKYRETLVGEGFTPIILQSNTSGYYRICVNSYGDEMEARMRVHQIRRDFPKYYDSWLLIKE